MLPRILKPDSGFYRHNLCARISWRLIIMGLVFDALVSHLHQLTGVYELASRYLNSNSNRIIVGKPRFRTMVIINHGLAD